MREGNCVRKGLREMGSLATLRVSENSKLVEKET